MTTPDHDTLDLAYDVSLEAYEWASRRYDALDARIHTMMSVAVTATFAVPVTISGLKLPVISWWLIWALIFFLAGIALATYARMRGHLLLISPTVLHKEWLEFASPHFKKEYI